MKQEEDGGEDEAPLAGSAAVAEAEALTSLQSAWKDTNKDAKGAAGGGKKSKLKKGGIIEASTTATTTSNQSGRGRGG